MRQLIIVFLLVISFVGWTNAQQTVTVDSKSNIFAAGRDNVSDPGGGGGGILPIELPLNCGVDFVNFTDVTGEISCTGPVSAGPDGKTGTSNISAFQGISGVYHQNS